MKCNILFIIIVLVLLLGELYYDLFDEIKKKRNVWKKKRKFLDSWSEMRYDIFINIWINIVVCLYFTSCNKDNVELPTFF